MARHISLIQLYEDNREKLMLNWVIGQRIDRRIEIKLSSNYGADVVGHINVIHPERLQVNHAVPWKHCHAVTVLTEKHDRLGDSLRRDVLHRGNLARRIRSRMSMMRVLNFVLVQVGQ